MLKGTLSYRPASNKLNTVKMLHVPSHNCIMHSPVYCLLGLLPFVCFIPIFVCFISLCILPLFGSIISVTISSRGPIHIKHKPREAMIHKLATVELHLLCYYDHSKIHYHLSKNNSQGKSSATLTMAWLGSSMKKLLRNQLKNDTYTEKIITHFFLCFVLLFIVYCLLICF